MGNNDQLSFLLLNKAGNCVDTLPYSVWPLGRGIRLGFNLLFSTGTETGLLGSRCLWPVLVQELEKLEGCNIRFLYSLQQLSKRVSGTEFYIPVCLSRVCENWLIGGGTFSLLCKTAFWR